MPQLVADGQLRHHFWGEYHATIVLGFDSEAIADQAAPYFPPDWERGKAKSDGQNRLYRFHGTGAAEKAAEAWLRAHGADPKKIGSLKYSIDFGEPFTITINTDAGQAPDAEQPSFL